MIPRNLITTKFNITGLIILLSTALLLTGCDIKIPGDESAKDAEENKEEIPVPVKSAIVSRGTITALYPSTTSLESEQDASVVAKVGGIVEKYFVEEGDYVKVGQPLVQLETERLKLELSRSAANLNKLKNDLDRTRAIYKRNLVSSETFDKLKFEYDSQKAAYALSKLELDYATVVAPIQGVISIRYVKVGNMVAANDPVFHITDFDPLHAVIYIPEKELYKIRKQQTVLIQVDARPGFTYQGFVKRISPVVDANSGTFKVTIEVTDQEKNLKPGMFGRLQIIYDSRESVLLIDKKALLTEDYTTWVFVIREDRAFKQLVKTGYVSDQKIEIISGLNEGDIIVTTGQNSLKDDSLIEVLKQDDEAAGVTP